MSGLGFAFRACKECGCDANSYHDPGCSQAPHVCPGCHAVGEEPCAPDCIDAEIDRELREAIESGDYEVRDDDGDLDLNESNDWEYVP